MSRWFRVYDSLVDDPKVQRLAPETFKALVNLWCLACRNDGRLPSLGDIAFSLRTTVAKAQQLIIELKLVGLIDQDATTGASRPHKWDERQFKSDVSNERVKRHRDRHGNGVGNVTSAVTATPTETDTETDKSPSLRDGEREAEKPAEEKPLPAKRASRLPPDFEPDIGVALSLGLKLDRALTEAAKFKDHYAGAPGQRGVKADWPATWRNWCRRVTEMEPINGQRPQHASGKSRPHDALLRAVAEQFAPGVGQGGNGAGPDEGIRDNPGTAPPVAVPHLDLAQGDYRNRSGSAGGRH